MAWSTPATATPSSDLTSAMWNASVRDNLLMTAPAKATTAGTHFVATGPNVIAERFILENTNNTSGTTTSASFVNTLTTGGSGPSVTITTGTKALVWLNCHTTNNTASQGAIASYAVSGASAIAASDDWAINNDSPSASAGFRWGVCKLETGLTAGSNVFAMWYRVQGGTGTFLRRSLIVMAL
jgi:hypothetical protein